MVVRILKLRANILAFDSGIVKIVEVVDYSNPPRAFGKQTINEVRTNEPSAACKLECFALIFCTFLLCPLSFVL